MFYIITMLKLKIQVKLKLKYKYLIIRQLFVKKIQSYLIKKFQFKLYKSQKKY